MVIKDNGFLFLLFCLLVYNLNFEIHNYCFIIQLCKYHL